MRLRSGSLTVLHLEVCTNALLMIFFSWSLVILNAIYCELLNLQ